MPSPQLKAEVLKAAMLIREQACQGRLTKTLLEGGGKQIWSDATRIVNGKTKQQNSMAGKSAFKGSTVIVGENEPKTVGADKVSDKGTSNSPRKSWFLI